MTTCIIFYLREFFAGERSNNSSSWCLEDALKIKYRSKTLKRQGGSGNSSSLKMVHVNMLLIFKKLQLHLKEMNTWERNWRVLSIYLASEQKSHRVEIPNKLHVTGDKSDDCSTLFTCLTVAMTKWPHLDFWIKNMEFSDPKCLWCMSPLPAFLWIKKKETKKKTMQWISK